ncbi:hypothetical protein [Salinicoccus luteus]|uniref:hypothetical protein n=1 Tax=Salinicoccus luteus TaxID=367840 RepID=UPI000AA4C066|nr:hypothetical protein [Salinicoccus luteus]
MSELNKTLERGEAGHYNELEGTYNTYISTASDHHDSDLIHPHFHGGIFNVHYVSAFKL